MSDSFRQSHGRKVVSRDSARELGSVSHLLVDAEQRRIAAVIVGRGKKARLVDWEQVSGFGPDAVMVGEEEALRAPVDDRERAGADGKLDMVGKRVLTERGDELGTLDDVTFDPATGTVEMLRIGDREVAAESLLGSGPYAVVLAAGQEPA
ncbi:MAG: PRC-barrel domain-containing protein [Acidimicrobiales bacterium]